MTKQEVVDAHNELLDAIDRFERLMGCRVFSLTMTKDGVMVDASFPDGGADQIFSSGAVESLQ